MAQEEPLYDFPEPSQQSERKFLGHQRSQGSLRSISVLDRLLLTVPVWLQMSINPATALHILQREPPGNFLVRKSRTSQRNVLCVRLADDTVPFFVQQFGIREEQSTLSLETSAISFPDLPRLISFYCVSRDVLPFILELPEAISKATSHKELESISHMGIEFWNSHLNFRGPREAPKKAEEKKQVNPATPAAVQQTDSSPQPDTNSLMKTAAESDPAHKLPGENPTLFHEFCPITTRSPRDLDCGSGQGALCFINPLFLQSPNALCRPHTFKRSFKVRVSTETSTMLSPPLSSPPPPPVMPKSKRKCKALKQGQVPGQESQNDPVVQGSQPVRPSQARVQPPSAAPHVQPEVEEQSQTQREPGPSKAGDEATAQLAAAVELPPDDSDYMQPSPMTNISRLPIMSHLSPLVSSTTNPLCSKGSPSASPHQSPAASPLCSTKVPCSLSLYDSPTASPCLSPYQSPSPSPKMPFSLSPFNSPSFLMLAEQAYQTPAALSRPDQQRSEAEEEGASLDQIKNEDEGLVLQMNAASLGDTDSCGSVSRGEGAAPHTPPHSPHQHNDGVSL